MSTQREPDEPAEPHLDRLYLPFTAKELKEHFVATGHDHHLRYYLNSLERRRRAPDPTSKLAVQIEKDERFWIITALKRLFDRWPEDHMLARLLEEAFAEPPDGYEAWDEALGDQPRLFFEVAVPAPAAYRKMLHQDGELAKRNPAIPHLVTVKTAMRYEGQTWLDAVVVAETGVAVFFEAKVLSDISCHTTWDSTRNQIARNVDVMLEPNPKLADPLSKRDPNRTYFALVTDDIFQQTALRHNRLYGWLMDEYRKPGCPLLKEHLAHRDAQMVEDAARRLGWITWQQIHHLLPGPYGACPWLEPAES